MKNEKFVVIDNIKWWVWTDDDNNRGAQPYCRKHNIRIYSELLPHQQYAFQASNYKCAECGELIKLTRTCSEEIQYILDKVESHIIKGLKFINIDDEAVPIAEDKVKNDKYFVTSRLMKSKVGLRLVVYAGEKGKKDKTQIFVEPEIKRLSFDQADLHPTDVFIKVEATFNDGTSSKQEK